MVIYTSEPDCLSLDPMHVTKILNCFLAMIHLQVVFLRSDLNDHKHRISHYDYLLSSQISEKLSGYKFLKSQFFFLKTL